MPILFLSALFVCKAFSAETAAPYIQANAIPIDDSLQLSPKALASIEHYKIVAVGEMHGNDKTPLFVAQLVKALAAKQRVILGLEITQDNQKGIDQFLKTRDLSILKGLPHFNRKYQDGRSSKAMAELIEIAGKLPNVTLITYDPSSPTSGQDRDTKMAENIISAYKTRNVNEATRLVLFAGNYHMAMKVGTPFDSKYRPALLELVSIPQTPFQEQDVFSIFIRYSTGSSWMCFTTEASECGTKEIKKQSSYSTAVPFAHYFLKEENKTDEGYLSSLFLRMVSASPPFVQNSRKGELK